MANLAPKHSLAFFQSICWYSGVVWSDGIPQTPDEPISIQVGAIQSLAANACLMLLQGLLSLIQKNESTIPNDFSTSDLYNEISNALDVALLLSQYRHAVAALSRIANGLLLYRVLDISIWLKQADEVIPCDLE